MPNDMPVYNTLTSVETRIVQAMRAFMDDGVYDAPLDAPETVAETIGVPLSRFLGLLWCSDPHVVDLYHKWDPDVSPFELQVLYAISEARAGDAATVDELLEWWYPADLIPLAGEALGSIARLLDDMGAPGQSSARLREHILCQSSNRRKAATSFVLSDDCPRPNRPSGPETIH